MVSKSKVQNTDSSAVIARRIAPHMGKSSKPKGEEQSELNFLKSVGHFSRTRIDYGKHLSL